MLTRAKLAELYCASKTPAKYETESAKIEETRRIAESMDDGGDGDPQAKWAQQFARKQTEKLCRRVKERKTLSAKHAAGVTAMARAQDASAPCKARRSSSSVCLQCKKNRCQNQRTTTKTTATLNDMLAPSPGVSNPMESHPRGPSAAEMRSVNTDKTLIDTQRHH